MIFSDHSGMRLEINTRKEIGKITNKWKLDNTFLSNQQIKEGFKDDIKKFPQTNENANTAYYNLRDININSKTTVHSNKQLQ